ncbi:MAG: RNA-binding protein [Paracoccaceae bacterium]
MNEVHWKKPRPDAERRCIVTREAEEKSALVRFVAGPDGQIVPDVLEKLPGRGIWVASDRDTINEAVEKRLFARAAKAKVTADAGLADQVETLLARRVIDMVSMGRKAGRAVAGLEKVKGWLMDEKAAVLLQASDGSERGKTALRPPDGEKTHVLCLTSRELGMAFGRDTVIHAAMTKDGITDRVLYDAARLAGLRMK